MASAMRLASPPERRDVTDPVALLAHQEPVDDLPRDQRREEARVGRGVEEPDEPHDGVQQRRIQRAHVDGRRARIGPRGAGRPASTMTEPTRAGSSLRTTPRYGRSSDASVIRLATGSAAVAMR